MLDCIFLHESIIQKNNQMPQTNTPAVNSTKWIIVLISIAVLIFISLFLIFNIEIFNDIWLWLIGLAGPIIAFFKRFVQGISGTADEGVNEHIEAIQKENNDYKATIGDLKLKIGELEGKISTMNTPTSTDSFDGLTITVLRYFDDNETTLGLLFIGQKFFCYTLEDTFREQKIKGETRIPSGTYKLNFRRQLTKLTKKYRATRDWFEYHLEIKNVPEFTGVYIHSGSNHKHTEGCLLIADSIYSSNEKRTIFNSQKTFERFYKKLKPMLDDGEHIRIKLLDEDWFKQKFH